jgi:periplasmic copper chaperone A
VKLAPLFVAIAVLALPACKQETRQTPAPAAVEAKPGILVSNAHLALPAVKGNPGAAYFTIENKGTGTASIVAVSVARAGKAELHTSDGGSMAPVDRVDVEGGATLKFAPGGLHVMVFDLDPALKPARTGELTVTFADGDKATVPLTYEAPGMAGMEH